MSLINITDIPFLITPCCLLTTIYYKKLSDLDKLTNYSESFCLEGTVTQSFLQDKFGENF